MLYSLIEELDPLNKALTLLYLEGNSYQEISDVLGITPTNVATKLNRLKETLRQKLAGKEPAANKRPITIDKEKG